LFTATVGVKAGPPLGVLIRSGGLQVAPSSVEVENATSLWAPPLKRASAQTTYSWPVRGSIAALG
jgi:hypothetical protein